MSRVLDMERDDIIVFYTTCSNCQLELEFKEIRENIHPELSTTGLMSLMYDNSNWGYFMNKKGNKSPQDFKLHRRICMKLLSIKWPLKNEVIT